MRQAQQEDDHQTTLATVPVELRRIVTEPSRPLATSSTDEFVPFEPRAWSGSGIELQYPTRLVWPSPWVGHIPFAFWLVEALRPRVVVELGVHSGNSYCALLQAVQFLGITAQCYGIDHWRGDVHSDQHGDEYGEDVCGELHSYHDPLYGTFSRLLRATFEEARPYFADQTIDLLHIDGFHTYEAVAKDFSDWLPKMSTRGVVLLHDINVREREFGVWRFWEEMVARFPTFAFVHSHGLGVAYVGSEPPPASFRPLLAASDLDVGRIRRYFGRLGTSLVDRFDRHRAEGAAKQAAEAVSRLRAAEADLEAARLEIRDRAEADLAIRNQAEQASAEVTALRTALGTARAEATQHADSTERLQLEVSEARTTIEALTTQAAAVGQELSRSRHQVAEAIAQRERATKLLRQQITTTAGLQRELAALRPNEAAARLVNRLAAIKHRIPRPVKHYIKKHFLGFRP